MINRDGLLRLFHRVLLTAACTKPFQDWNDAVRLTLSRMTGRANLDHMAVVCYFDSEDHWFLIALNELVWRQQGGTIHRLSVEELAAARIDLRVNRDDGFVSGRGFGTLTLVAIGGTEHHVKMEPGSATEATLRVVIELIRHKAEP
jgi:hypothetical protein